MASDGIVRLDNLMIPLQMVRVLVSFGLLVVLLVPSPTVRAIGFDIAGPSLGAFEVSASTVDVTSAPATIYVDMRVTDESGVVSGDTGAVYLQLNPPLRQIVEFPSRRSGTATDGVWRYTFVVPAGSTPGTWELFGNQWKDLEGNYSANPNRASVEVVNTIPSARAAANVKPTIGGAAMVAMRLTANKGFWTGYPAPTFTYQWFTCTKAVRTARATVPARCKKISGATKSSFRLTLAQRGMYVAVLVTGKSSGTAKTSWLSKSTSKVR